MVMVMEWSGDELVQKNSWLRGFNRDLSVHRGVELLFEIELAFGSRLMKRVESELTSS